MKSFEKNALIKQLYILKPSNTKPLKSLTFVHPFAVIEIIKKNFNSGKTSENKCRTLTNIQIKTRKYFNYKSEWIWVNVQNYMI